jgi:hypothetical protein
MLRERDHPAPAAPLDVDWMLFAACSELEVVESDRLFFFFCGQDRSRQAMSLARPILFKYRHDRQGALDVPRCLL